MRSPAPPLPTITLPPTALPAPSPPIPVSTPTSLPAATSALPPALSVADRQLLFMEVWNTIDQNYLYPDFRGLDWQAVRAEFEPRVAAVESDGELYALLSEMVRRLNDEHSRFLAPSAAAREDAFSTGREQQVGIGVLTVLVSDGALIQTVFPDSPAAQAGLRPRDRIVAVDGVIFQSGRDIEGPEGSQVRLTVMRPGEEIRDVVLTRRAVEGRITPMVRRLPGDVGYLSISTLWVNDMDAQVNGALTDLVVERPLNGLILDLRGNPGGWRSVLTGLLSHFVRGEVGVFFNKHHRMPLHIEAGGGPDLRGLPLAILIDGGTASYAELLAGILQIEAGAYVVGTPSAGNTETIYAYELANGARLWVAQEGFLLSNGVNLEGRGVQPDAVMSLDWTRYSEAADPGILQALQLLYDQRAVGRQPTAPPGEE